MTNKAKPPVIFRILDNIDAAVGPLILLAIFIDVLLQILSRVLPGSALPWTVELGEILLGALIWLGISVAARENMHVGFDLLVRRLKGVPRKLAGLFATNLFIVYLAWLAILTLELLAHYQRLDSRTTILNISMYWVRFPILLGCISTIIRLVIKEVRVILDKEDVFVSREPLD